MTPDPMRATAERLAREVYETRNRMSPNDYNADVLAEYVLAGLTHRDRTAEREAARKAWDAAVATWGDDRLGHTVRDRYLAAEFDAAERVTLSDGSVVTRRYSRIEEAEVLVHDENGNGRIYALKDFPNILRSVHTGADFDAVKRLAEQRGAER